MIQAIISFCSALGSSSIRHGLSKIQFGKSIKLTDIICSGELYFGCLDELVDQKVFQSHPDLLTDKNTVSRIFPELKSGISVEVAVKMNQIQEEYVEKMGV